MTDFRKMELVNLTQLLLSGDSSNYIIFCQYKLSKKEQDYIFGQVVDHLYILDCDCLMDKKTQVCTYIETELDLGDIRLVISWNRSYIYMEVWINESSCTLHTEIGYKTENFRQDDIKSYLNIALSKLKSEIFVTPYEYQKHIK